MAAGSSAYEHGAGTQWIENRAPTGRFPRIDLRELFAHRELVFFLALKDLKLRFKQTALGVAWAVVQPLIGVAVFSIFLRRVAHLPSEGVAYPLFAYAGYALWSYLTSAVQAASQSLIGNVALVTKVYFPRLGAPLAAVLPGIVDLLASLVLLGAFMAYFGVAPGLRTATVPLWVLAAVLLAFAIGAWVAALSVRYRDVRNALPFVIQIWFFASPIVYPSSLIHSGWRYVYALNPMVGVVDGFRWALVGTHAPGLEHLLSLGSGLLILAAGLVYFAASDRSFADVI